LKTLGVEENTKLSNVKVEEPPTRVGGAKVHTHTRTHALTHACMHAHTHTHSHTLTHTHTHTHS
jgi:hypothetical protein